MKFLLEKNNCQEVSFGNIEYSIFYAEKCDFCIFKFTHFGTVEKVHIVLSD